MSLELDGDFILKFVISRMKLRKKEIMERTAKERVTRKINKEKQISKDFIAKYYLHCNKANLSRKPIQYEEKEWYDKLFNLENKKSALYGENEFDIMSAFKFFVGNENSEKFFVDLWEKEYKAFFMESLWRCNQQSEEKSSSKKKNVAEIVDVESTTYEEILKTFKQEISSCNINKFIESKLPNIDSELLSWVALFIKNINADIINLYKDIALETPEKILYIQISEFINALEEYNKFLENNTAEWRFRGRKYLALKGSIELINPLNISGIELFFPEKKRLPDIEQPMSEIDKLYEYHYERVYPLYNKIQEK